LLPILEACVRVSLCGAGACADDLSDIPIQEIEQNQRTLVVGAKIALLVLADRVDPTYGPEPIAAIRQGLLRCCLTT
jgi:hypothetical protein